MFKVIYVRVITHDLPENVRESVYSAVQSKATPEKTVARLNVRAMEMSVNASYRLATEEEYWAYRTSVRKLIAGV